MPIRVALAFILCAAIVTIAVPTVSHAGYWDGFRLKEFSDADDRIDMGSSSSLKEADFQSAGWLFGYVAGVSDSLAGILFCPPDGISVGQALGIVKKFIRENPEELCMPAGMIVIKALSSAFPCEE